MKIVFSLLNLLMNSMPHCRLELDGHEADRVALKWPHSYALHHIWLPIVIFSMSRILTFRDIFQSLKSDWPLSFPRVTRHFEPKYFAHSAPSTAAAKFPGRQDFCQRSDRVQFTPQLDCSTFIHPNFADYIFGGTDENALVAWEHDQITGQQRVNIQIFK